MMDEIVEKIQVEGVTIECRYIPKKGGITGVDWNISAKSFNGFEGDIMNETQMLLLIKDVLVSAKQIIEKSIAAKNKY